jgi:hypothetical protein
LLNNLGIKKIGNMFFHLPGLWGKQIETLNRRLKFKEEAMIDTKRKILRRIFSTLSLSSVLFVFQACYGTPRDIDADVYIEGLIKARSTNQPVNGIKVSIENHSEYGFSDVTGKFKIFTFRSSEYKIKFEDTDSSKNGSFMPKDTTLKIIDGSIFINVSLDEK